MYYSSGVAFRWASRHADLVFWPVNFGVVFDEPISSKYDVVISDIGDVESDLFSVFTRTIADFESDINEMGD